MISFICHPSKYLSPFRNTFIRMTLFRWGSSRRAQWRSWWSPWQATRGSSSPPTSTSSSPLIGLSLRLNKCSTCSQKGKHKEHLGTDRFVGIFWWVSWVCSYLGVCIIDIGTAGAINKIGILSPRVFEDLGITLGYTLNMQRREK